MDKEKETSIPDFFATYRILPRQKLFVPKCFKG